MPLIECQNAEFCYDGKTVLSDVSFTVNKGDYLCVVGENGSGKTTLINGLLGLIKLKSGSIVTGDGLTHKMIGYLPQQTPVQKDFPASVYEVVISGCLNRHGLLPIYSRREKAIAEKNIQLLEINDIKDKCYHDLSGGQQQRVLLARALCAASEVLLLDEPVAGLDPLVTNSMYEIIYKLNRQYKMTIIMVSHDLKGAISYATHILHLENKPLFFGTKEDYLETNVAKKLLGGNCQ